MLVRSFEFIETILGLLAAFVLGIAAPAGGLIFGLSLLSEQNWPFGVLVLLLTAPSAWSSGMLIRLAGAWERDVLRNGYLTRPTAGPEQLDWRISDDIPERDRQTLIGYMAFHLPELHWLFRVWCAFFWLVLVAAATYLGHILCRGAAHAVHNDHAVLLALACAGHLAFLVAANLFLVLAAAVLMPGSNDWLIFYRGRFVMDAAALSISLAAVFAL